jgi:hypothetical protein
VRVFIFAFILGTHVLIILTRIFILRNLIAVWIHIIIKLIILEKISIFRFNNWAIWISIIHLFSNWFFHFFFICVLLCLIKTLILFCLAFFERVNNLVWNISWFFNKWFDNRWIFLNDIREIVNVLFKSISYYFTFQ